MKSARRDSYPTIFWQNASIMVYREERQFSAVVKNKNGLAKEIPPAQIHCGILGTMPHAMLIEKVSKLSRINSKRRRRSSGSKGNCMKLG
jgi:hypothetical protein